MGLRAGCPRLGEAACLRHDGGHWAEPHRLPRPTEDAIGQPALGEPSAALGGGAMAGPAAQARRLRPGAPERGQEPDDAQRGREASGTLAWPEAGGHQGVCSACDKEQR